MCIGGLPDAQYGCLANVIDASQSGPVANYDTAQVEILLVALTMFGCQASQLGQE